MNGTIFHHHFFFFFSPSQLGYECISLAFHPFGSALAAGSSDGHLVVVNAETGSTMLTLRVCGSALNCLEYNQIGDMIAMGSQNGNVHIFFGAPFYTLVANDLMFEKNKKYDKNNHES